MTSTNNIADQLDHMEGRLIHFDDSMDLGTIGKDPSFTGVMNAIEAKEPLAKRLMAPRIFGSGTTECTFNIMGTILEISLLPYTDNNPPSFHKATNGRQIVKIGGHGSLAFANAYAGMWAIYDHMSRSFKEGALQQPPQQYEPSQFSIKASNLWLLHRRKAPTAKHVNFTLAEDPERMLETTALGPFVRTAHNQVEYVVAGKDVNGNQSFTPVDPNMFNVGDIVQLQVNFVAFPLKHRAYKFDVVLKRIIWIEKGKPTFFSNIQMRINAYTKRKRIEGPPDNQQTDDREDMDGSTAKRFKDLQIHDETVD